LKFLDIIGLKNAAKNDTNDIEQVQTLLPLINVIPLFCYHSVSCYYVEEMFPIKLFQCESSFLFENDVT